MNTEQELLELQLIELQRRKTNHVLHLILTILTAGLWLVVWILVADSNNTFNAKIGAESRNFILPVMSWSIVIVLGFVITTIFLAVK